MKLNKYKRYDISKLSNAQIIDLCNDLGENPEYFIRHKDKPMINYNGAWYVDLYHDKRRKAMAITDIEKGTMMAVKSLF